MLPPTIECVKLIDELLNFGAFQRRTARQQKQPGATLETEVRQGNSGMKEVVSAVTVDGLVQTDEMACR